MSNRDVEPWIHTRLALSENYLKEVADALVDPMCESNGHKKTIRACRLLHDELMRLRAHIKSAIDSEHASDYVVDTITLAAELGL